MGDFFVNKSTSQSLRNFRRKMAANSGDRLAMYIMDHREVYLFSSILYITFSYIRGY